MKITVEEWILVRKTVDVEPEHPDPEPLARQEAYKKLAVSDDSGWEIVDSDGPTFHQEWDADSLVALAGKLGLESRDLDEFVHTCHQEVGLTHLNSLEDGEAQDDHITALEREASSVNNGGVEAQIEYLLEHNSAESVADMLEEAKEDK